MSHPGATIAVMGITSLDFGSAARALGRAASLRDLVVPVFASPPPRRDLDRSIRRRNGSPIVSVRLKGRPRGAVLADMIEGIVVANYLTGARADLARSALWLAVDGDSAADPATELPAADGADERRGKRAATEVPVRTNGSGAAAGRGQPGATSALRQERVAA